MKNMEKTKKQKIIKRRLQHFILKLIDIIEVLFILFVFITLINFVKNNQLGTCEVISMFYVIIRLVTLYTKKVKAL